VENINIGEKMTEKNKEPNIDSLVGCVTFVIMLLLAAFAAMKFTSIVTWDWVWVISPLWFPTAFVVLCSSVGAIYHLLIMTCKELKGIYVYYSYHYKNKEK